MSRSNPPLRDNATHKARVKTPVSYRKLVRLHVAPVIGRISLTELTPQHVERMMASAVAGLPAMRYHDLRHGAASLIAAQGVPARVAMEVLGHAQISTTMNIYSHVAPEFQKEASERVAAALRPGA